MTDSDERNINEVTKPQESTFQEGYVPIKNPPVKPAEPPPKDSKK